MVGIINKALVGARNFARSPVTQFAARNATPILQTAAVGVGAAFAFGNARDLYNTRSAMAGEFQQDEMFPSDLIQNDPNKDFYMSFKFQAYEKRAINSQPFLRSQGTIRLPIPDNIRDNMSVSYNSAALGPAVGAALEALTRSSPAGSGDITQATSTFGSANVSTAVGAFTNALEGGAAGAILNQTGAAGQAAQAYFGIAVNPYQTVLFERPEFKSHMFSWKFMPRDEVESSAARNIFRTFQYHMSPGVSETNGLFFSYPSMLAISLYPSSEFLYRFKPCIIKSVNINYAAGSSPSFFKRTSAPTAMTMSIELQEIEYWTNKDFTAQTFNQTNALTAQFERTRRTETVTRPNETNFPGQD